MTSRTYPSMPGDRTGETDLGATVRRRDFVRRSTVVLKCPKCGTTTWGVAIEDAAFYEAAALEHICGLTREEYRKALETRGFLLAWLRRFARDGGLIP